MNYDEKYLWRDPVPESLRVGVLLSDQIRLFVEAVHLIEPTDFIEGDLRPAAYDLHIGDTYYVDDQPRTLGPKEWFKIRANGLVYVKTQERFNIPYYMIARYSLRVHQVYRGLLIDNGLHIDPGYHGPIYVPVHNFMDQDRPLSEGEPFLSIEFTRTTPLPKGFLDQIATEADLASRHGKFGLDGHSGHKVILFNKSPADLRRAPRTPKDFWNKYPGEEHKSAMLGTEGRLETLRQGVQDSLEGHRKQVQHSIDRLTNISFFAALGIVAAIVSILLSALLPRYLDLEKAYMGLAPEVQSVTKDVEALKKQLGSSSSPQPAQQPPVPEKAVK